VVSFLVFTEDTYGQTLLQKKLWEPNRTIAAAGLSPNRRWSAAVSTGK